MRILVTGGAGFIGSHVADAYVKLGHDVAVLDDLSRGFRDNVNPRARFYREDICDGAAVESVFADFQPEIINHHAAQMDVRRAVREPLLDATINIVGSLNLLEAARKNAASHFIYVSSAGAGYGEPEQLPVPESYPLNPITPYGITKHTVEHYLYTYQRLYGMTYVVLRYGNVYGPRQSSKGEAGVFAMFCEQMLAGMATNCAITYTSTMWLLPTSRPWHTAGEKFSTLPAALRPATTKSFAWFAICWANLKWSPVTYRSAPAKSIASVSTSAKRAGC